MSHTYFFLSPLISVSAQYERRTAVRLPGIDRIGRDSQWGIVRRPSDIIRDGLIDRTRDFIDNNFVGGDCYQNEVPSFWNGRIDTCSYLDQQCYNPLARCRITKGSTGTCCERRGHNLRNRCYDNTPGQGSCHSDRECLLNFGSGYECQFRGGYGTCCSRYNQGIRYWEKWSEIQTNRLSTNCNYSIHKL